ncbi:MAG TPA: nodulation protein NfeD [Opitutaceae bacterium]
MKPRLAIGIAAIIAGTSVFAAEKVGFIEIDGAIGPATAGYIERAIRVASEQGHSALILRLDTPGGLLDSTKEIVQAFYASEVPVVVHVAPPGANAGSAGVFITLAADVAAMAPNTSIGAAHPVAFGGASQAEPDETMKQKLENYAVSYIEAIAEKRGRNVEWAKSAVKDSASITAEKALELRVIEIIAADTADLLAQLDNREVRGLVLKTVGAEVEEIPMILRERVFQMIWRPEVMFVLMLVAIYGLLGEMSNPGTILPGVTGTIALILALYMSAILPVNIAGIALIVLAIALFIFDAIAPTHGILTTGGVIAFFIGSMMLFDTIEPAFRLSLAMIIPATLITSAFFIFVVSAGIKAQFLPVKMGAETLAGAAALALSDIDSSGGRVLVEGEDWRAVSDTAISEGQPVEIISVRGLSLAVKPKHPEVSNE